MLVWIFVLLVGMMATYLYVNRVEQARFQSMLAGGRMGPGCIVAEVVVLAAIAAAAVVGHWLGILRSP
jgi:hypothetical protein